MEFSEHENSNNYNNGKPSHGELSKVTKGGRKLQQNPAYSGPMVTQAGVFDYWRVFLNRKGTILITAALGIAIGLVVSVPRTPIYQARTTVEIQGLNDNLLNTRDVNPSAPSVISTASEEIQTQIKILKSDSLIAQVMNRFGVSHSADPLTRLKRWRLALGLIKTSTTSARDAAVAMAASTLQVDALQQAHIIQITTDSTDPKIAADFLNALTDEFINQKMKSRLQTNHRTAEWLDIQLEELKVNLEKSEDKLQDYGRATGLMFTSEEKDSSVAEEKLHQLQSGLSEAQADRVAKQSKYEIAKAAPVESLPQILEDGRLRDLQSKLTELRSQLAELKVSLTPAHPRVLRIQAQIGELEAAFQEERNNIIRGIANQYEDAKRREELLSEDYAAQTRLVSDQGDKVAHYEILKREAESNRQLYESMLHSVKQYGIASAVVANNVNIVDPARAPSAPYKPDVYMYVMLGLATGLFLGLVLVIQQEKADRSIHAPSEAPLYLNVPELGVVLSADADSTLEMASQPSHIRSIRSAVEFGKRIAGFDRSGQDGKEKPRPKIELISWEKQFSLFAECFRTTAASLLFSEHGGTTPQAIVVTSANPQDGKSTIASNLAVALAETQRRVLIIDADLRRPDLHRIFKQENRWGLIDILQGDIEIREYPSDMLARETAVPNVHLLTTGTANRSIVHLLHSTRLPELIQRLRQHYDLIVIDAPPVLQIADARVLGRLADGVVFVVRSNRTTRDMAMNACRRFQEDRTRVLGTVLNMWDPRDSSQKGYYYSNTYYEHYAHKETTI
jgi:capsular exopolysaccharide synthesis family protein